MKKSFLILSMASLLSASVFAKNLSFSNPRTLLPNEDVQSFELADLDGNGKQEIVYLTSNGELKYAALGHYITESSRDILRSSYQWAVKDRPGITMQFDDNGYMILKEGIGGGSNLYFKDGTFSGNYVQQTILIDYISDTEISGTFKDGRLGIDDEVPFTAVPK
ncbi:hypothetical protein [Vibrio sp. 10N.261.52.A1]|uniref:hypothetical protein n=1 Tax=Vibrio TaxID=662 RepID=UPI000C82651B|nr:hypothetical protein [Vibrio sp. 10N.261.52.A1]PML16896.1 hypothetical protein BCT81_24500 [Vibrio sp. 10N.261.52.A1]